MTPDTADLATGSRALPPMGTTTPNPMSRDAEPDITPLLRAMLRQEWVLVCCGRRTQPDALAAVHQTQDWADVVVLRGHDRAAAYRTLSRPGDDPLQANCVVWHYLSDAERTVCAVLMIPPETAASVPYPIPEQCRLPEALQRPVTIRLGGQTQVLPRLELTGQSSRMGDQP